MASLVLVPRIIVEGRTDGEWWQWPPVFNTFAVLVTNYAGWGVYRGWRTLLDYDRETHFAVVPVIVAYTVPALAPTPQAAPISLPNAPVAAPLAAGQGNSPT